MRFIEEHRDGWNEGLPWGVDSICDVLTQHDVKIAPLAYVNARGRQPSAQGTSVGPTEANHSAHLAGG